MVSTPVQNLSNFLKNRPPLVVFLICLVALAVSLFYFAFEIEKDGPVIDSDKKHDWIQMIKHFNKLDICINSSTWENEIKTLEDEEHFKNEISVFTTVSVPNASVLSNLSDVHGALSLEGWYSTTCQDQTKQPKSIEIFFDVPHQIANLNGPLNLCVAIKGLAEYLPFFKEPLCQPLSNKNSKIKGFLSSKLPRVLDSNFCQKGNITKMEFDLAISNIENYLSDDIRTQIYIHLMWCSYFLVFVIFGFLLFSILKKSDYLEKKEQSARLL